MLLPNFHERSNGQSTRLSRFDPFDKRIGTAGKITDVTCDFLTATVHQNQRREAFDAKFGRERACSALSIRQAAPCGTENPTRQE